MEYMESRMQDQIEGAQHAYEAAMKAGLEPAFPTSEWTDDLVPTEVKHSGINKRDLIAIFAMTGLCGREDRNLGTVAVTAYNIADAMLAARVS